MHNARLKSFVVSIRQHIDDKQVNLILIYTVWAEQGATHVRPLTILILNNFLRNSVRNANF